MRFHSRLNLGVWLLAIAGIPAVLRAMPSGCPAPPLRSAASFAVLGRTVMSSGPSIVTGNLGVSSGTPAGFPPGRVNIGTTFHGDATVQQAQNDATAAYGGLSCGTCTPLTNPNLGGMTLGPGVYCSSSPLTLTGTLILDAAGDPNAVWVFRTTSKLTTDANASVLVIRGGWNGNVFWQAAGSVTLNTSATFVGNILTPADISLGTGVNVSGRLLAGGAVTLNNDNVSLCCDPITLSPMTLPNGTVCTPYSNVTFSASGGTAPYSFSVTSASLPDSLVLTGGVLSGTPSRTGTFNVAVTATDAHGCSGTRVYPIVISCPVDDPIPLPQAKACVDYNCQTIKPSCGTGPLTSGDLPDGLTLSPDGMLCGKPTTPGDYVFTVADQTSGCSRRYAVRVVCNVMISPPTLPDGTCSRYSETLTASCGTAPYTFSAPAGTLPAWLSLSPDGKVFGIPTTPGSYPFTVTVTDAKSCTVSRPYTVVVNPQIAILPSTLPPGVVCKRYFEPITPSCGVPPYTCSVTSGSLPPGLALANCVISGKPAVAGSFTFTVTATDSGGSFTTHIYTIVISCPVITISPPVLPPATTCPSQNYCVQLTPSCQVGSTEFTVTAGSPPPGLHLSPDGLLCGMPLLAGLYSWTVTFTDSVSGCTGSVAYTLPVTGGVTLTPATLPDGWPAVPYSEVITASGGTAPYTFVVAGTLPPGLAPSTTQTTLTISGTPTTVGCFPFTVTVTDATGPPGCSTSITYTICVATGGPTLSGWGMVALSVLLVGVAFVMMRRGAGI